MRRKENTLYEVLDQYTGEAITYQKVTNWYDGTPMNDSKADGVIYRKYEDEVSGNIEYFKRVYLTLTPEMFGAIGNGIADDTTALQTCLNFPQKKNILLRGDYLVNKIIITRNNLNIIGDANATIRTNSRKDPVEIADVSNVYIENIRFINDFTSPDQNYSSAAWGMIYSINRTITNLTFNKCYFSIPSAYTNAVKLVCEQAGYLTNVRITNSTFENIARMAFETQNHNNAVDKWTGISVENCVFRNLGLIIGTDNGHGMAVSISGMGKDISIQNNLVDNALNIGIEVTGGNDNTKVINNSFINNTRIRAIDNEPFCFISVDGKLDTTTGKGKTIKAEIYNNVQLDTGFNGKLFYRDIVNGNVSNNRFNLSGYKILRGIQGTKFINNFYQGTSDRVVYLEAANDTTPRPSINNYFQEVIVSTAANNNGVYLLSTNVNNNEFDSIVTKTTGQIVRDSYNQYNVVRYRFTSSSAQVPFGVSLNNSSADYTLSEELATYPVLNFQGTLPGQRNIFIPSVVASNPTLVVINSTNQTLRFVGVGGSAGTLIRAGYADILSYRKSSNDFTPMLSRFGIYPATGTPEASVTASPGRIALSDSGKAYVKVTGTNNIGWDELTTKQYVDTMVSNSTPTPSDQGFTI